MKTKKIAILGAECSGKSTLAKSLAIKYKSIAVFEYLRYFCTKYSIPTNNFQQYYIANKQIYLENLALKHAKKSKAKYIFCDTTPLLTCIYSDFYIKEDKYLLDLALKHQKSYDLVLLVSPNIAWIQDGLRDSQEVRKEIFIRVYNFLILHSIRFRVININ